ncbi:hypothetical protein [Protaetiibacter intestinalis]|uniref:Uncharacterized protein n=1 Tax=Protaetiibacter intestinalis TaxID=2419774 RepID=A0A387B936_9MICO|nr:hypothetical protein [Protaetiibacter intestinalis]AYF97606.1 hypothetical protein D7I47_04565 [Protaetiibacter intestinalis]
MAEQPAIDPRYDPAFQRGFDGAVATGSRAQAAARRSAPYVASALQRPVEHQPAAPAEPPVAIGLPPAAPAEEPQAAPAASVTVQPAPLRPPWTNPFVIVLTVLGALIVAGGVWLLQENYAMMQNLESFQTQADYWVMQVGMTAGPLAIAVGVLVLAGVLFLAASYWARRPHPPRED